VSLATGSVLALLGLGRGGLPGLLITAVGGGLIYRGASGHRPLYQALDMNTATDEARPEDYFYRGIHVEQSYLINKSPQELYGQWRNFENLPKIMTHLERVDVIDEKRSHWSSSPTACP
jgi:uncharacterized membrane protein